MSSQTETTTDSDASGPKRPLQDLATGNLNVVALIALVGGFAALLCAVVYLFCMTYTLVHYRSWDDLATWPAFFVSLIFAVLALLSSIPLLIAQNEARSTIVGRCTLWGTCLALAGLQLAAAVLGDASFSLSALVGMTAVIGVACFAELAGHGVAES
ncbi:hypothetical protein ABZ649_20050 [Streptomyces albidoflavus]|uniref:hypothetical protein n=1 Tax=Streptomyces albidoflavus TaxID=1886 RepID=UPI001020F779|nr:hypothetical protein [Streptomyces albidoflavus]RZE68161.1 hypothetical protein C0Q99_31475 [Streptomyces albidoflavus]WTC40000.1 hypothetical protein OH723_32055 [Streptomyces albidoflavus]WTC45934.1 hypothetical protein OH810_30625 [Streptomyces albidoflavus]